jgi:hypothetical protein
VLHAIATLAHNDGGILLWIPGALVSGIPFTAVYGRVPGGALRDTPEGYCNLSS